MNRTRSSAWGAWVIAALVMLVVLWNSQAARAEGGCGSGTTIGGSIAAHGPQCGGSGNCGGVSPEGGRAGSVGWQGKSRRGRPDRNRWEENKGKRASGAAARKRARARKGAAQSQGGGGGGQGSGYEQGDEGETEGKRRRKGQGEPQSPRITTERIDGIPVLIGMMVKMGLPQVLDNNIPRHWKQRSLSWGWTATLWLAYILSEGDHRKVVVREYVRGMRNCRGALIGQEVDELDFTDDRLGILLTYLSRKEYWRLIEEELGQNTI